MKPSGRSNRLCFPFVRCMALMLMFAVAGCNRSTSDEGVIDPLLRDDGPRPIDPSLFEPLSETAALSVVRQTLERRESWARRGWTKRCTIVARPWNDHWFVLVSPPDEMGAVNVALGIDPAGQIISYQTGW